MELLEALRGRRAVRAYADTPLRSDQLDLVLRAATWAPSGMNRQPWRFYVVEGREALSALSERAKAHALAMLKARAEGDELVAMLEQPGFDIFYDAPALVIVCAAEPDEMALKDCCLAAQNLMLAAFGAGLGTCWIGLAEGWLATPEGKAWLGLPETVRPIAPIIIGVPAGPVAASPRLEPEVTRLSPRV